MEITILIGWKIFSHSQKREIGGSETQLHRNTQSISEPTNLDGDTLKVSNDNLQNDETSVKGV